MNFDNLNIDVKYLSTAIGDDSLGLKVNTVGFQIIQPNTPYPVRLHPNGYFFNSLKGRVLQEYQLIYITKGSGVLLIDSKKYKLKMGDVFVIYPNQWHSYYPDTDTGWNEYYIGFKGLVIAKWMEIAFRNKKKQVFEIGLNAELVRLFRRAIELAKFEKQLINLHISGIVYHIMGLLISEIDNGETLRKYDVQLIERAKILMNENIYKNISPEEIAEILQTSYVSFRKQFKKITGFAPGNYFLELKMNKAKQLLLETSLSIKEISVAIHLYPPNYFTTIFKKKTGYSPYEFRTVTRNN